MTTIIIMSMNILTTDILMNIHIVITTPRRSSWVGETIILSVAQVTLVKEKKKFEVFESDISTTSETNITPNASGRNSFRVGATDSIIDIMKLLHFVGNADIDTVYNCCHWRGSGTITVAHGSHACTGSCHRN